MPHYEYWDIEDASSVATSVRVKDGAVIEAKVGNFHGVRVRAFFDGAWAYFASARAGDASKLLAEAKQTAKKLSRGIPKKERHGLAEFVAGRNWKTRMKLDPNNVSLDIKVARILELDCAARIKNNITTSTSYADATSRILLKTSDGIELEQSLVRCGAAINCVARKGGALQSMFRSNRGSGGWEIVDGTNADEFSVETARKALSLLGAKSAPAGKSVVILDPLIVGTFIHEALGHMAESDHVANRDSVLEGKLGKTIASKIVNVTDDKTVPGGYGTFGFDRDGVRAEKTVLIENGVLKSYMNSRTSGGKLGLRSTGNCRGEFNQVRMSNTMFLTGDSSIDEMIKDTKKGVYMIGASGGTALTVNGMFNFGALEGYEIKNGRLGAHLKDVALMGNTLETLMSVDAVGGKTEPSTGTCGKNGEWVPVGSGGPHIRTVAVVGGAHKK